MKRTVDFKKGSGYITSAFITLFVCLLILLLMTFWSAVANVQSFKGSARNVLDTYVGETSVGIFDGLKNSDDRVFSFNSSAYNEKLIEFCGLTEDGGTLKKYNPDLLYTVSVPTLSVDTAELNIKMECTVTVPLYFCGIKISDAVADVSINSFYEDIFD